MRYSLKEGLVIGVSIGVVVLLVQTLLPSSSSTQIIVLVLVAMALAMAQLLLGLRRSRRRPKTTPPPPVQRATRQDKPKNPFARETNQAWTGLQPPEEPSSPPSNERSHE